MIYDANPYGMDKVEVVVDQEAALYEEPQASGNPFEASAQSYKDALENRTNKSGKGKGKGKGKGHKGGNRR